MVEELGQPVNIVLCVEYDGSNFKGWQAQKSPPIRAIEAVLQKAVEVVANHPIVLIGAGRTDAGVHARNQIVNFLTHAKRSEYAWVMGINSNLPKDCTIKWAKAAPLDFHARFSAQSRHYQYLINTNPYRSALSRLYQTHIRYPLNIEAMQNAAKALIGEHDFAAFRSSECQAKTTIREITAINLCTTPGGLCIDVYANAFLHHMVRNLVGVLLAVGSGKKPNTYAAEVLASKDRKKGGITAPPQGLYLMKVVYPITFNALPQ